MSVIELKDVSVTFHEGGRTVEAVKHVTLNVDKGEIFGIVGFSGAGKSTLVRTINLLERPTGGQVVIDGNDITGLRGADLRGLRKKIGFIFQGFNLIGNVTVGKNIEFALKAGGYPKSQRQDRIRELLTLVGLENKIDSYPSSLSGGQKQRVSIARALANKPEILLCDEATSALDLETTEGILALLQRINREHHHRIHHASIGCGQADLRPRGRDGKRCGGGTGQHLRRVQCAESSDHQGVGGTLPWHRRTAAVGAVATGRHHRGATLQGRCGA